MTLFSIFKRYRWRIIATLTLVFAEAGAMLFLPLAIGGAIDGLLANSYQGLWWLVAVGLGVTISGSLRRVYDTRVYSGIYVDISTETAESDITSNTSTVNARMTMLRELVEFLENDLPELLNSVIGLVGTVIILLTLDLQIFFACLAELILIIGVFLATSKRTTKLNYNYNNAMESQVTVLENRKSQPIKGFMQKLMYWNIKLSDLETIIFGIIWLGMVALIVYSVIQAVGDGSMKTGAIMATVMYVMQFAEGSGMLPLYFQKYLRLQEISSRLRTSTN